MSEPLSEAPSSEAPLSEAPETAEPAETADAELTSEEREQRARRPVIEKARPGHEIIIPEGHQRGEVMSFGQKIVYWITWIVATSIAKAYFRTKVYGKQHVPKHGAFIISPIHRSNLDTPVIALVTTRRMRYMGKESLWKRRWSAWYFTAAGGFPVERATADRSALNACLDLVRRGEPLVMFPEGTRQSGPVVTEMFDGPSWLACRAQIPILPVGIGGSARAMGKGVKVPKPSKMTIVIGEPIYPPKAGERGRVPRRAVRELTEELRGSLQELFDEAQELAGTPNQR